VTTIIENANAKAVQRNTSADEAGVETEEAQGEEEEGCGGLQDLQRLEI
jgi:hypothetical protein